MKRNNFLRYVFCVCISWLLAGFITPALAERPASPTLLPKSTLAYLRITDAPELVEKFQQTAIGNMAKDEKIEPLIGQLYGSLVEAFGRLQDEVGVPLGELLALPQGEACLAIIAMEEGPPAVVVLLDCGDRIMTARTLIERGEELMSRRGDVKDTELFGDVQLTSLTEANRVDRTVVHFEKESTIGITSNIEAAKQVLTRWNSNAEEDDLTLTKNRKFTTIMNRSRGTKDERPQFSWFVDPIELVKVVTRDNSAAQIGLAILPALGVDGLQAVGGSIVLATEEFDGVIHLHVMLDNPRAGIIELLALTSGETEPEAWVPPDVYTYTTLHWDMDRGLTKLRSLYDSFQGDGEFSREVQRRFSERLGIDFEEEFLNQLDGRFTILSWFEPPARVNSEARLLAMKVKDADSFRKTIQKVVAKFPDRVEEKMFGGVTYYQTEVRNRRFRERAEDDSRMELRRPQPCVAMLDDYVIICGSVGLLERIVKTNSEASKGLAKEDDFKLIAESIKKHAVGSDPGLITFNRPEEGFKMLYDLVNTDNTRRVLAGAAENNGFFRQVNEALQDNPLPPFEDLQRYLAPGGGMVINDESGFHYIGFSLKTDKNNQPRP